MTTKKDVNVSELGQVFNEAMQAVIQAALEWKQKNTKEKLREKTFRLLDQNSDEIVLKLLGFNNSWSGKFELDHCNGRSGESAAGQYLRAVQSEAIMEWLKTVKLPDISASAKKSLIEEAKSRFRHKASDELRAKVDQFIEIEVQKMLKEVVSTDAVAGFQKLMNIIDQNQPK